MNINKIILYSFIVSYTHFSTAEDMPIPDKNAENIKKVTGVVIQTNHVDSSRRGSASSGIPAADLVEAIFGTNYVGFPIYHVKINETIAIDVGSRDSFKPGDCVLVWYDSTMGDSPDLSMPGQAGIEKSKNCN